MMMDRLDELKFHKLNAMVDIVIALVSRPTDAYSKHPKECLAFLMYGSTTTHNH